jgi:hypothetical protein
MFCSWKGLAKWLFNPCKLENSRSQSGHFAGVPSLLLLVMLLGEALVAGQFEEQFDGKEKHIQGTGTMLMF